MITIYFNRVSKILICYVLIMCKSKLIKIRIMVNPRQKCTMCDQISLPRISWKGTTLPINVKAVWGGGGGGGRAGGGDLTFFKNLLWNSLPMSKSFQSNAQKFPSADKFYQVAMVREKWKIFQGQGKVREFFKKSGNSVFWRNASRLAMGL